MSSVLSPKLQLSATTRSERNNSSQLWHCSSRCASAQHSASLQRAWRICRQCSLRGQHSGAASPAPHTAGVCWRPQARLQHAAVLSSTHRCTERRGSPRGQPATCGTARAAAWRGTGALRRPPTRPAQPRRPCRSPRRSASAPRPAQAAHATRLHLTATLPGVATAPGAALSPALAATRAPRTCKLRRGAVLASLLCDGRGGQDVSREPSKAPTLRRARVRPGSACCRACSRRARCTWATTWAPSATGSTCRTSTARGPRPPPACQPPLANAPRRPAMGLGLGLPSRAPRRHVLLRRGPARGHAAARPGGAARGDARERGAVPGGRHRPRPRGNLRAVARARARRAGLAAAVLHANRVRGRAAAPRS